MAIKAFVMNMFYTGLGIARSLGERGVPVVGLTSRGRAYGSFTRYAKLLRSPDSREEPEALLEFLLKAGWEAGERSILFPTRDDDLAFLDRFRKELTPFFSLVLPESSALKACLNKWETYLCAQRAGVAAPKCWMIEGGHDLRRAATEVTYPCVLKPLSSHHWRVAGNWEIVGARKAIAVTSERELFSEYDAVARADKRAIIQEMVSGGDDCLVITASYLDRGSRWVAGFNTQKLVQVPEGFGTGCIVEVVSRPELFEPTARLLQSMNFSGIAEVEYKWDAASGQYKLIEVNPRPWDQHRLGNACGVDLIYMAYCEHGGFPMPALCKSKTGHKWVADDTFVTTALRMLWRRDPKLGPLLHHARGTRVYAIWSALDPFPFIAFTFSFAAELWRAGVQSLGTALRALLLKMRSRKKGLVYESHLDQ
jgi:predicted ATP-grasp superfamily ATP-dependent carboligase